MRGSLMELRNQVEQEKHPSFAQKVQDLVHARDKKLAETADLVEFLVVDNDGKVSRLLRDDHQRDRRGRGRVLDLDQAYREVMVQGGVHFLGQNWVDLAGLEVTGAATSGTEIFQDVREKEPKSVLDLEEKSAKRK